MTVPGGYGQPPSSLLDYYASVEQGSNRRFDEGLAAQAKQAKGQLDNAYRIAKLQASTQAEQTAVDRWYKQQQVALAQKTFDESVRQFDKTYGLQEADTTGWFGGKPTLAREAQDAALTGMYGGQPTMAARELERKYGLATGELTGYFNGTATAAERERLARLGITQGELMGVYNGQQTLEAQELARRFGLDQQKFGLTAAQAAAEMRSRPDMLFQYGQFAQNLPAWMGGPQTGAAPGPAGPQGQTIAGTLGEIGMGGMSGPWGQVSPPSAGYLAPAAGGLPATGQPLTPQEQARWEQLMARHDQLRAAGGPGLEGADLEEARRFQAKGATWTPPPVAGGQGDPTLSAMQYQPGVDPNAAAASKAGGGHMGHAVTQGPNGEWQAYGAGTGTGGGWGQAAGGGWGQAAGGGWGQAAGGAPGPDDGMRYAQAGAGYGGGGGSSWFQPYGDWSKAQQGGPSPDMAYLSMAQTGQQANPVLAAIGKTYQAGFDKLGAQSLEKMDPNERGFLKSGGSFQGYDYDRELRKYAGSRLGQ